MCDTMLVTVLTLTFVGCNLTPNAKPSESQAPLTPNTNAKSSESQAPLTPNTNVAEGSSVIHVHIRDRLYVGWGALFSSDFSTLSGSPLPKTGQLRVAVGANSNCPLTVDTVEQNDNIVISIVPGDDADQYCGLEVEVQGQRSFYKIIAVANAY